MMVERKNTTVLDQSLGAKLLENNACRFCVWAPLASTVELYLLSPGPHYVPMDPIGKSYYQATVESVAPGTLYLYRLDGKEEYPDPTSRYQLEGVHGPSAVVRSNFSWTDGCWRGIPLEQLIIYELHIGTFYELPNCGAFHKIEC